MVVYLLVLFVLCNMFFVSPELIFEKRKPCHPDKLYKDAQTSCVCMANGTWPSEECQVRFEKTKDKDQNCDPNKLIFFDCNVCRCGLDGKIDSTQCTKHKCNKDITKTRRSEPILGNCEIKKWYQLASCQLCYCVNKHKLICNSKHTESILQLGKYKMNICGEKLMEDLKDLIPTENKGLRSNLKDKHYNNILDGNKKNSSYKSFEKISKAKILHISDKLFDTSQFRDGKPNINSDMKLPILNNNHEDDVPVKENDTDEQENTKDLKNRVDFIEEFSKQLKVNRLKKPLLSVDGPIFNKVNTDRLQNDATPKVKIVLPKVLDKLLRLAIRKSMVSLSSMKNCKPGSATTVGCNTCFCLTNKKMLCTKKDCR